MRRPKTAENTVLLCPGMARARVPALWLANVLSMTTSPWWWQIPMIRLLVQLLLRLQLPFPRVDVAIERWQQQLTAWLPSASPDTVSLYAAQLIKESVFTVDALKVLTDEDFRHLGIKMGDRIAIRAGV